MKGVLVLLALVAVSVAASIDILDTPAINQDIINQINSDPTSTWVAGRNDRLEGLTLRTFSKLLGTKLSKITLPVKPQPKMAIPDSFDARQQWPKCIGAILDQGHCGSCWAFGACESLGDRFCIQTNGATNVSLSEQLLVSCDDTNGGCDGGELITAWDFLVKDGTVTSACYPYAMGTCQHPGCSEWNTPACNKTCQNGDPFSNYRYYAKNAYAISSKVADIQTEIMTNGPVEVAFEVYSDFATYKSGVYIHKSGSLLGGHAVKNIGWGVDETGVDYWIIQNSWNPSWGMQGYFLIRRGTDECGIESNVVAGLAKV
jgi:cathepsin B